MGMIAWTEDRPMTSKAGHFGRRQAVLSTSRSEPNRRQLLSRLSEEFSRFVPSDRLGVGRMEDSKLAGFLCVGGSEHGMPGSLEIGLLMCEVYGGKKADLRGAVKGEESRSQTRRLGRRIVE
jgi:hypothetical protein